MIVRSLVKPSGYSDSVSLMLVARELAGLEGVHDAAVVMATEANKSILADAGLLTADSQAAGPNDLVLAVSAGTNPSRASPWRRPGDVEEEGCAGINRGNIGPRASTTRFPCTRERTWRSSQ